MTWNAVIFDWAGTMVDFGSLAPVRALQAAFAQAGVALDDAEARHGMGLAKREHVAAILTLPQVHARWVATHGAAADEARIDELYGSLEPRLIEAAASRSELIPGAAAAAQTLQARGLRLASTTGYTRAMMASILAAAAHQGYAPELVVCAGETKTGRPSPLMVWKALVELGVWPAATVVKVDDAPVGVMEGKSAGCFTVGVAASGTLLGLDLDDYHALPTDERGRRLALARAALEAAGADLVIDTVADLPAALASRVPPE